MVFIMSLYKLPRGRGSCRPPTQQWQTLMAQLTVSVVRTAHAPQYTLESNYCELLFGKEFIVNSQSKRHTHWTTSCSFANCSWYFVLCGSLPHSGLLSVPFQKQNFPLTFDMAKCWSTVSVSSVLAANITRNGTSGESTLRMWPGSLHFSCCPSLP